jgi:formylmethanofuran dehydrogenase subunit D
MKLLLTSVCILLCSIAFAQQKVYSYSFSGEIDSSFVKQLENESMQIDGVKAAKAKYKVGSKKGEVILYVTEDNDKKDPHVFNPASIKAIFIRYDLKPGQFIAIKTSK